MNDDPRTYKTIRGRGESAFDIRGSEFLGHAAPAASIETARSFITSVSETYDDATHNVPAYRVPSNPSDPLDSMLREYADDAGEPSGTAGRPALNVLQQRELQALVVVVTRYYGGTNLGTGGLSRCYARAVREAVDDAGVTERQPRTIMTVRSTYDDSGTTRSVLESVGVGFDAAYEEEVVFRVEVPIGEKEALADRLRSATSGRADITCPDTDRGQ